MSVPTPAELIERYGPRTPEQLAEALGFHVCRLQDSPALPGVRVFSAYQPAHTILLYQYALRQLALQQKEPLLRIEQWHIAHELYHALAEAGGMSAWRVRETAADLWADELLTLMPLPENGDGSD